MQFGVRIVLLPFLWHCVDVSVYVLQFLSVKCNSLLENSNCSQFESPMDKELIYNTNISALCECGSALFTCNKERQWEQNQCIPGNLQFHTVTFSKTIIAPNSDTNQIFNMSSTEVKKIIVWLTQEKFHRSLAVWGLHCLALLLLSTSWRLTCFRSVDN